VTAVATPPAPVRRRAGLARHRDFRLLWAGQASSRLGSSMTSVALPLIAVAALDATAFQAAVLYAAAWLPWLLIGLPVGAWVDRRRQRPILIACDATSAVLFLSVPVAAWLGVLTIGHLLVVALAAGAVAVVFETACQVYLPALLDEHDLAEGNAKLHGTDSATKVAGPGLAGLLAQAGGVVTAVLLDAVSFVVSALCLRAIRHREPAPAPAPARTRLWGDVAAGIRFVARDPYLRVLTAFGAASNIGLIGYQAILTVFLIREVGVSAGTVGLLVAAMSCGGVLGAGLATRLGRWLGTARAMIVCELGALPFGLLIPLAGPGVRLALPVVAGMVIGAGVVAGNVLKGVFRQRYTPAHLLGRVIVSMQFLNLGAIPLGGLIAGVLAAAIGVRPAMWVMTASLALSGGLMLLGPMRHRRDLPDRPARSTASGQH
jgi:MFS family permease